MLPGPDRSLRGSTVWAVVATIGLFLAFCAFIISEGRSNELRSLLILFGQGAVSLVNIYIVYRATQSTNAKVDTVQHVAEQVKEIVNGTGHTPPPGTIHPVR